MNSLLTVLCCFLVAFVFLGANFNDIRVGVAATIKHICGQSKLTFNDL